MSDSEFVITRDGYEEMRRELNEILTVKRPRVIERIRDARQVGDPAESSDYEDAKRFQAMLEARVKELKAILSHASIVEAPERNGQVGIGSKVVVKDIADGTQEGYIIVGPAESSPAEGKISHESCVGGALLDCRVGDVISVEAPGGTIQYEIVSID